MALEFFPLTIAAIEPTAGDAVVIEFNIPQEHKSKFDFLPGQHLTLRHYFHDEPLRRFYSICSLPDEGNIRIGVRKIDQGRVSGFFNSDAKIGDVVSALPPRGRFNLAANMQGKHLVALVAGSGITPIYPILAEHLNSDPNSTATLIFGNRNTNSMMLRQQLNNLKDSFVDRFQLINILSQEQQEFGLLNGRIDQEKIAQISKYNLVDFANSGQVLLCGPSNMIDVTQNALVEIGVDPETISFERFTALEKPVSNDEKPGYDAQKKGAKVSYILDGVHKEFQISNEGDNVLEAAQKQGLELPFSCAGGMCATCRCKLVEGEVEMAVNYSLEPWELEAGYVLACQSRPKTSSIKLDFDES